MLILKGSIASGAVLGYNGSNIYAVPDGTFATQAQLSTDESNIETLQYQVGTLQNSIIITSVTSDDHLQLIDKQLSLNLSAYINSSQISENYTSLTMGNNLDMRVTSLENDHVTTSQFSDLSNTVAGITPYITSVSDHLNVNSGVLSVDLSSLAPRDGASFTGTTELQNLSLVMGSGDVVFIEKCYYVHQTDISQNGNLQDWNTGFGRTQHFKISCYLSGAVNGIIEMVKMFRYQSGSGMTEVQNASSVSLFGNVNGDEINVINNGTNYGCSQTMTYNLPPNVSMVVKLSFSEQPSN